MNLEVSFAPSDYDYDSIICTRHATNAALWFAEAAAVAAADLRAAAAASSRVGRK